MIEASLKRLLTCRDGGWRGATNTWIKLNIKFFNQKNKKWVLYIPEESMLGFLRLSDSGDDDLLPL